MYNPFTELPESYAFDAAYRSGAASWDIGEVQPGLQQLLSSGKLHGDVLDIGCGTGEHSLAIAGTGSRVLGIDFSPAAVHAAKTKAHERGSRASFLVWDALKLHELNYEFDSILDSACYHTLDQKKRKNYVESLSRVSKAGTRFFLLASSESVPLKEIRENFSSGWNVLSVKETEYVYEHTSIEAYLTEMQKI